jgi:hypothetical protein
MKNVKKEKDPHIFAVPTSLYMVIKSQARAD